MKITKRQLRRIIKEEKAKILREMNPSTSHMPRPDVGDKVIDQALSIFPQAIIDEDFGEIVVDTGLRDDEVEALYSQWISIWPNAEMGEGGLIYPGIPV